MYKFLGYLLLFYVIYFILKYFIRIYTTAKSKSDTVVNRSQPKEKKSQIDKDKIVDAEYEEL